MSATEQGWYYLHANGELIYKGGHYTNPVDFRESDLVRAFWKCTAGDREEAWTIVVEALAAGANPDRVRELVEKWNLTDEDAQEYARRVNANLFLDGDHWCATCEDFTDLQESPSGFGEHAYEALAALAKALGYAPSKMWGHSFASLVSGTRRSDG